MATKKFGHNGTITGGVTLGATGPLASGQTAMQFDGSTGYVSIDSTAIAQMGKQGPVSFEAWFKTTAGGTILGMQSVAVEQPISTGWQPVLWVGTDGKLYAGSTQSGGDVLNTTGTVNDGAWHYVVYIDAQAVGRQLYLDGSLVASKSYGIDFLGLGYMQIGSGYTGFYTGGASGWYFFTGEIGPCAIYNRVLASSEITAHNNAATDTTKGAYRTAVLSSSPYIFMPLHEISGTIAYDQAFTPTQRVKAFGLTNTVHGGVTAGAGVTGPIYTPNPALRFDGSSGYVEVDPSFRFPTFAASIEIWFNLLGIAFTDNPRLICNGHTDSSSNWGFELAINSSGTSGFVDFANRSAQGYAGWTGIDVSINWHYYVATYDGSAVKAYIDGVLVNTGVALTGPIAATGYPINVGRNPEYNGDYAPGVICLAGVYNYALTQTQITNHYQAVQSTTRGHYRSVILGDEPVLYLPMETTAVKDQTFKLARRVIAA